MKATPGLRSASGTRTTSRATWRGTETSPPCAWASGRSCSSAPRRPPDLTSYVYSRVDLARLAGLRADVDRLFAAIERGCGVRGRWLHRRDDAATYMEVYEDVKNEKAFEAGLEREGAKLGVPR